LEESLVKVGQDAVDPETADDDLFDFDLLEIYGGLDPLSALEG
jgi:hypothetical protein